MQIRPVHIWWLGVALFVPSVITWGVSLGVFIYKGFFDVPFDWFGITRVYLPFVAAILGFATPILCLRFLKHASCRLTGWAFAGYLSVMLIWATIDIRHQHYQMGGHGTSSGSAADGHGDYWHVYYTWYFIPYRWIEQGIKD